MPHRLTSMLPHALDHFDRRQRTTRTVHISAGEFHEEANTFEDDWTPDNKRRIATHLNNLAHRGGIVLGMSDAATKSGEFVAFAAIEPDRFGPDNRYANLSYLHVSGPHRGTGLGGQLWQAVIEHAAAASIPRLYIAAHPSVDTINFYRRNGCIRAAYIHPPIYERESRDLQLECVVTRADQPHQIS